MIKNYPHGNHHCTLPKAQTGAALLALMLVLIIGSSYFLVTKLNVNLILSRQSEETGLALSVAKDALIGYAVSYPDKVNSNSGPGYLPCPDITNNGSAGGSCSLDNTNTPITSIGRFPYATLESEDLRDNHGERFWYVISDNFRNNPKMIPLNSETASNTSGDLTVNGYGDIAAVIFAADAPENSQNRTLANENDYTHYIEATFTDNDSDTYIDIITTADTDRYILLTKDELMRAVEKRVLGEVSQILTAYNAEYLAYPWLQPFADPKIDRRRLQGSARTGSAGLTLNDSTQNFTTWGVAVGDILYNITDGSRGVISSSTATSITVNDLSYGSSNSFSVDDRYAVFVNAINASFSGTATAGSSNFVLEDSTKDFEDLGVSAGDIIENMTDGLESVISSVDDDEINVMTGANFDITESYRIRHNFGVATGGSSGLILEDNTRDISLMNLQSGSMVVNQTDGSFGVVDTSDATTITVQGLAFGTDNEFEAGDTYFVSRFNEIINSREGQLAFHEPGKYFTGDYILEWSMLTADHEEADDFVYNSLNPNALTLDSTYLTAIGNLAQTSNTTGAFTLSSDKSACEWIATENIYCMWQFMDVPFLRGAATADTDSDLGNLEDTSTNFVGHGIKPGDIILNYTDRGSAIAGMPSTATSGSSGTVLEDTSQTFSGALFRFVVVRAADNSEGVILSGTTDTLNLSSIKGTIDFSDGDVYNIYPVNIGIVTGVSASPNKITAVRFGGTFSFDTNDEYRIRTASSVTSDEVVDTSIANNITVNSIDFDASGDFSPTGVQRADTIYNVDTGDYGFVLTQTGTNSIEVIMLTGSAPAVGENIRVYHHFVQEREYKFAIRFRGTGSDDYLTSDGRERDVCIGYGADCSSAAANEDMENVHNTNIHITDTDQNGNVLAEIDYTLDEDGDTDDLQGSIKISGLPYYLSELDPIAAVPAWFIENNWHQLTYIAYSEGQGDMPGAVTACTDGGTPNCLILSGSGSPTGNKRAIAIIAGSEISADLDSLCSTITEFTQNRSSGQLEDYFEGETYCNSNNDIFGVNVDVPQDDLSITDTFNDQIRILNTAP